jgi:cupin 2 domain-containing protein
MTERGVLARTVAPQTGEAFSELARLRNVVIEEIVSSARPVPTEYVQPHDEWVVVLDGAATLDVAGAEVSLARNEWICIPSGTVHHVVRTDAGTRWLAVHVHPDSNQS